MIVPCPNCNLTFPIKDYETSLACIVCLRTTVKMSHSATPFKTFEVNTASYYCTTCNLWLCDNYHSQEHYKAYRVDITRMDLAEARFKMRCSEIISKVKLEIQERHKECENQLQTDEKNYGSVDTVWKGVLFRPIRSTRQMQCTSEFELQIRWWNGSGVSLSRSSSR